jgi:hypothetical protein
MVPTVCIMMSRLLHWGTACSNEWKLNRTKFNTGHFDISFEEFGHIIKLFSLLFFLFFLGPCMMHHIYLFNVEQFNNYYCAATFSKL